MFENLGNRLQDAVHKIKGYGKITEDNISDIIKEVRIALLEADVNFRVVKNFIKAVQERAIGQEVLTSLTPGQMVIKFVNEEMVKLMGETTTEIDLLPGNEITVIMMCGLQGAGKTTTTAKIAGKLKAKGKKPLLVACDIYRPAAIEQLQINGDKQDVPVFSRGTGHKPVNIAKAGIEHARNHGMNVVILDTALELIVPNTDVKNFTAIRNLSCRFLLGCCACCTTCCLVCSLVCVI